MTEFNERRTAGSAEGRTGSQSTPQSNQHTDVKDEAGRMAQEIRDKGKAAAEQAKDSAEEVADEQMKIGAEHMDRVSGAIAKAADDLSASSPLIAHYARSMASGLSDMSGKMRNQRAGDILRDATAYARREPMVFFGAAVLAGFVLSRFVKSSGDDIGSGDSRQSGSQRQ